MSITAMKQALDALWMANTRQWPENKIGAAINALSAAIEQAEKQPEQRQWVGLTDAEIAEWDYDVRDVVMDIEKLLRDKNT
jgi:hypothetical protein